MGTDNNRPAPDHYVRPENDVPNVRNVHPFNRRTLPTYVLFSIIGEGGQIFKYTILTAVNRKRTNRVSGLTGFEFWERWRMFCLK